MSREYEDMVRAVAAEALATLDQPTIQSILDSLTPALEAKRARDPEMFAPGRLFTDFGPTIYFWVMEKAPVVYKHIQQAAMQTMCKKHIRVFASFREGIVDHIDHGTRIVADDVGSCMCSMVMCQPYDTIYIFRYRPEFDDYV